MVAASCLENMARGLMKSFARYREIVVPPMLERLKERKANVTDAIGLTLDAVFSTVCDHHRFDLLVLTPVIDVATGDYSRP